MHPDAGQLRVGGQSGGAVGEQGLECLGRVCGYGVLAGGVVGDGDILRDCGEAAELG